MQVRRRKAGAETSKFPQLAADWRSPLTPLLRSVRDRLKARAVAAYVTGASSNQLLLADHVIDDVEVGAPLDEVELEERLTGLLVTASAPVDGNRLSCQMFFDSNGLHEVGSGGASWCTWVPVRWDGWLAGGLAVVPSSRLGFSPPELTYLSMVARELARRMRIQQLTVRYRRLADTAARDELVLMHLPLVERICRRFAGNSDAMDDLRQVGAIALLTAVGRYQPHQGNDFAAFASPCIVGELMNYFRDCDPLLKVPRSLRRLRSRIERRSQHLAQEMGRFPSIDEIAVGLQAPRQTVVEALRLDQNARPLSIDTELDGDGAVKVADFLAEEDPDLEVLCDRITVRDAIARLHDVYKVIIVQRFYQGRTQEQIARRLGISQPHVSRLQRRALLKIKTMLADDWV